MCTTLQEDVPTEVGATATESFITCVMNFKNNLHFVVTQFQFDQAKLLAFNEAVGRIEKHLKNCAVEFRAVIENGRVWIWTYIRSEFRKNFVISTAEYIQRELRKVGIQLTCCAA